MRQLFLLLASLCIASSSLAATYYVDPSSGCSDANSGTSPTARWCTPPGTRTANNSGFLRSSWGAITPSAKISCGDTILLKGGSRQTSGQGGAWRIDPNHYASNCTSGNRIRIRVASTAEWPGSSNANFVLDGSGIGPTSVNYPGSGGRAALVDIENLVFVQVGGFSTTQRLEVANSADTGIFFSGPTGSSSTNGIRLDHIYSHDNDSGGFDVCSATNFQISNSLSANNGRCGFCAGCGGDSHAATHGAWVNTESTNNGNPGGGGGYDDGYFWAECDGGPGSGNGCWIINAYSHDNWQRGLDTGGHDTAHAKLYTIRGGVFRDNGKTNDSNTFKVGACTSGGGNGGSTTPLNWSVFQHSIFYHNRQGGGTCAYGTGLAETWNSVFWNNAYQSGINPIGDVMFARDTFGYWMFNSIVQKRNSNVTWHDGAPNSAGAFAGCSCCPVSNYNLYRPVASNTESIGRFYQPTNCGAGGTTYADPPNFIGPQDKVGIANTIGFVATNDSEWAGNDFHLTAGSSAIDGGTYFMRANGTGTNATTVNVTRSTTAGPQGGTLSDPRAYFVGPGSYVDAIPDVIQIQGCGPVTITGMTANSISFTPACSWANGAGIHLRWTGSAPDMGVFEYGLAGGGPTPPTLLSVEPLP
jgi:hypothetical protein